MISPQPGRRRATRTLSTLAVLAVALGGGLACLHLWPAWSEDYDRMKTPFLGEQGANGFIPATPVWHHTDGQRRAHRWALAVIGLAAIGSLAVSRGTGSARRYPRLPLRVFRGRWICAALCAWFLLGIVPSLDKTPDLARFDDGVMATVNNHFTFVVGHADRLAAGDVLFRDVTPKYGVLLPTLLGTWERHLGLLNMRAIMRLLIALEILYLAMAVALFAAWSRWRWLWASAAVLLMLPFYYSRMDVLLPPNHGPWRMLGIPLAVLAMCMLRSASSRVAAWTSGLAMGAAILINLESGLTAALGLVAYLVLRHGFSDGRLDLRKLTWVAGRSTLGLLIAMAGFVLVYRLGLGTLPSTDRIKDLWNYARLGGSGLGSHPYVWDFWPVFMFAHAGATLLYTLFGDFHGHRRAMRAGICTIFLTWFAYYFNRPVKHYMCSYMFLYGFLLIDALRSLALSVRRPRGIDGSAVALAAAAVALAGPWLWGAVEWRWDPTEWRVKTDRWSAPLVDHRTRPSGEAQTRLSKIYVQPGYAARTTERADYLRARANGRRLIYFSPDSYLIPRLSGVFPLQEYIDPSEALDRKSYQRLCRFVARSREPEIYFDCRDESQLYWCGGVYRLLRSDVARWYRLDRVESGWEKWVRR